MKTTHILSILSTLCICTSCKTLNTASAPSGSHQSQDLSAPASLAGATISIQGGDTIRMKTAASGTVNSVATDSITYRPRRKKADFEYSYTIGNERKINTYTLSGDENYADSTKPATITFTSRQGKTYKGYLNGYVIDGGWQTTESVYRNTPVTITLK